MLRITLSVAVDGPKIDILKNPCFQNGFQNQGHGISIIQWTWAEVALNSLNNSPLGPVLLLILLQNPDQVLQREEQTYSTGYESLDIKTFRSASDMFLCSFAFLDEQHTHFKSFLVWHEYIWSHEKKLIRLERFSFLHVTHFQWICKICCWQLSGKHLDLTDFTRIHLR